MAQPPLTRQIRALEEQVGVRLFERGNRGTELTEAGKRLLQDVPNILALTQSAEEQARLAGAGLLGRLDVGIFSAGILNVVPRLLSNDMDLNLKDKVVIITGGSRGIGLACAHAFVG